MDSSLSSAVRDGGKGKGSLGTQKHTEILVLERREVYSSSVLVPGDLERKGFQETHKAPYRGHS